MIIFHELFQLDISGNRPVTLLSFGTNFITSEEYAIDIPLIIAYGSFVTTDLLPCIVRHINTSCRYTAEILPIRRKTLK